MKFKFNRNILLFVLVWGFLGVGILHPRAFAAVKAAFLEGNTFSEITAAVEAAASNEQRFHNQLVSLYTVFLSETGSDIIKKDDGTVIVRMKNGQLDLQEKQIPEEEMDFCVQQVRKLAEAAKAQGAEFLYVMAPLKGDYGEYPTGLDNFEPENYAGTLRKLTDAGIPVLDLKEKLTEAGMLRAEYYFNTDHHWRPQTGLWASGVICEELGRRYGFEYEEAMTDISNYTVETMPKYLLGSITRKVGRYFSRQGKDDFEVLTPKFETLLTEYNTLELKPRTGDFTQSVCFEEKLKSEQTCYAYYSGGDFRLQTYENLKKPEGKTILMVRDSYACTVAPFLALEAGTIIQTDTRNFSNIEGPQQNVYDLIGQYEPDYVLVLYSGGAENGGERFEFGGGE